MFKIICFKETQPRIAFREGFYTLSVDQYFADEPIFSYLCLVFTKDTEFLKKAVSGAMAGGFLIEAESKAKDWLAARCRLMIQSLKKDIAKLKEDKDALSESSNLAVILDFKACELAVYELKLKQISPDS